MSLEWAVGLFEGEGCIGIERAGPALRSRGVSADYRAVRLSLAMTDEDVVRRFATIVGVGNIDTQHRHREAGKEHHKPTWRWRCHRRDDVRDLLEKMLPLLGERRAARAREALAITGRQERLLCP